MDTLPVRLDWNISSNLEQGFSWIALPTWSNSCSNSTKNKTKSTNVLLMTLLRTCNIYLPAKQALKFRVTIISVPRRFPETIYRFSKVFLFFIVFFALQLTLSWRRTLSYRNQSIDLLGKSVDRFLYDNGLRHERIKEKHYVFHYASHA